ncbi:MAG: division/cell wall cluster transcriptional repressor MraZ [bacterium]|nr:division/cell wall cluster transcriptional repressor MraZ [bacterium]
MPEETAQFIGEYENVQVDPKGRLFVPATFRKALPMGVSSLVVARWFDGCLAGYDPGGWKQVLRKLQGLDGGQKQTRQLIRAVLGRAQEVKLDGQGRILISRKQLDLVGISDSVTINGALDRIEIWNPERYITYMSEADQKLEEIVEEMDLL